jgi:hypothetical protein
MTLHLLGIRHHGPGSARSVLGALDDLVPDVVLVELPADVEPALRWVGHVDLVPPVALLSYVVTDPACAAFAPLASFSPEWQAIAWANAREVPVRAIDLPLAVTLARGMSRGGQTPASHVPQESMLEEAAPPDPLRDLAAAAGDDDPERWWEDVIEHRGDGAPAFDAVAEAMHAARAGYVATGAELQREAHMRRAIRTARRDGFETIVVVCGAWHVPALDLDSGPAHGTPVPTASVDAGTLRGLAKTKVAVAWVPWTHQRLTARSGYGAGVESPGWYRHVFEHPGSDGVARFFVDAARLVRDRGGAASPDEVIAGTRLAASLAAMRDRPRVGLAEVLDAADAVTGGLDLVRRELVIGDAIGEVPDAAPQVPLARDVAKLQRSARMPVTAQLRTVEVDLRTPQGRRKSHLLHRLVALGIGWGVQVEGRGSSGTFRETWEVRWDPDLSIRLIERAGYGTTLEAAATARLVERAAAASGVPELVGVVEQALFAELPLAVEPSVQRLSRLAATDPDVGRLLDVMPPLAAALRYGDVRGTDADTLRNVVDGIVVRILAGLRVAARSLDDDAAALMSERLSAFQGALAVLDHPARHDGLPAVLVALAAGAGHGLVEGRATRLLHDGAVWSADTVQRRMSQALSGGTPPARGAAFVEGFLAGSGSVLVHDTDLLGVLDGWVASLPHDAFDAIVVLMRRTFGAFGAAERRQLMAVLMGRGVERPAGFGDDVDPARSAAALVTVRHLLGLPVDDADRRALAGQAVES